MCVSLEGASVHGERDGVSVDGHVICARGRVSLFARYHVRVLESMVFHELKEYLVVHSSEGTLEIQVDCVYVSFEMLASSYIMMCVERLSHVFMWEWNPSTVSLKTPLDSVVWVSILVRTDVHSLSMQFIRTIGL